MGEMNLKVTNITKRIKELDTEISKLEQRLAAINWERRKYLEFSSNQEPQLQDLSVK